MKKILSIFLFSVLLFACNSGGKESIRQISIILPEVMDGITINESDCWTNETNDAFFKIPEINFFKNERISKLIEENKDYKLTDDDRRALAKIIDDYTPHIVGCDTRVPPEIRKNMPGNAQVTMIAYNLKIINRAETLGDLLL